MKKFKDYGVSVASLDIIKIFIKAEVKRTGNREVQLSHIEFIWTMKYACIKPLSAEVIICYWTGSTTKLEY